MTEADERHLRHVIELAVAARAADDMPFGSLLVGPAGDVCSPRIETRW
jgi:tRNA(Arg) A34 adenosine deaminase TadA